MQLPHATFLLALAALLPGAALAGGGVWHDSFDGPRLDAQWTVDTSPGASCEIVDGRLQIRAALNTFAHAERALGQDNVTASVLMQPSSPSGVSWAAGLTVYWSPAAWCQLAVIDPGDGIFYVAEVHGSKTRETYLTPCDRARPHWLRIELARDCVRYLTRGQDEAEWTTLRVTRRPPEWVGPPKLLLLGKGYGAGEAGYPAIDLDNDYADPGPPSRASFDDVTVELTAAERVRSLPGEIPATGDPVGERLLAEPGDPTYDQVASVYPPMRHVREAVGPKWHPDEVGVTETGGVELGVARRGDQSLGIVGTVHVTEDLAAFGSGAQRPAKSLLEGHLPVVIARWADQGVEYEETIAGYSRGLSDREPLYAYVRLVARSANATRLPVSFRVTPDDVGCQPISAVLDVPPGGAAAWCFRVPCPLADGQQAKPVTEAEFGSVLEETRRFWEGYLAEGTQIRVPEPRVMDAYRAWLAYNAIDVDRVGDYYQAHDGSGFYEEVYGYSAARYAWVLDLYGRHTEAAEILRQLRSTQTPEGLIEQNFGLTDTGTYLLAVAEHYQLTGDDVWLRDYLPSVAAACKWLTDHRAASRSRDPRVDGLIKHRSYCDYWQPVYGYLHNCYCCVGMERVAVALRMAGLADAAEPIAREAAAYRSDIERSMRAATVTRDGRRILPMEPDTQRLLRDADYDSRDYYGLVASSLLEIGFLAPESRDARDVRRFLLECGGIRMGTSEFQGGIDHAYGYGYLEQVLACGDPERYLLGFYTALAYGMTRETFSSVECTQVTTGENAPTLPHLYSGTQQLLMLRTMLVREEGKRLVLLSGVPRPWLEDGEEIEVTDAPTPFGPVDLRVRSRAAAGWITVDITPPAGERASGIALHLRHPDGKPISSVVVNGRSWRAFSGQVIDLPGGGGPLHVIVTYER